MRICSFLPSATEILFALGLGDSVVGVTFECDYPAEARSKAIVVYTKLPPGLPEREIDRQVNEFSSQGRSLYRLDAEKLRELKPELIVTQDLCHVCAASPDDLAAVLGTLSPCPQVLALTPRTIADVWNDIITVGNATGRTAEATALVANLEQKIAQVRKHQSQNSPRVLCLEWLDPPFAAGHWVPEMVELAGGIDVLGRAGEPGVEVSCDAIEESDPDIVLAMLLHWRKFFANRLTLTPKNQLQRTVVGIGPRGLVSDETNPTFLEQRQRQRLGSSPASRKSRL